MRVPYLRSSSRRTASFKEPSFSNGGILYAGINNAQGGSAKYGFTYKPRILCRDSGFCHESNQQGTDKRGQNGGEKHFDFEWKDFDE